MNFSVNSCCDLCCQPVRKGRRSVKLMKFPGCHGLPSVLNEHLVGYFIAKKLLELKDDQFLEFMIGDGDLRSDILNCFCEKCEDVIIEAFELHMQVVNLQRTIKKLGVRLKELLKLSWKGSDNVKYPGSFKDKKIALKIRQFIDNEDSVDKPNVKIETDHVKAELYNEEESSQDFPEEDSFMDSFSNTLSDAENDSILSDPASDEDNELVPSKRRRKIINSKGNASHSDDSEYKPEEEAAETKSFKMKMGSEKKSRKRKKGASSRYYGTSSDGNTCHICGMFQKTSHGFRNHMNVHEESTKKYGNKYDCPKCKYPTISEFKLRYHMTKAHQETHNNTCSVCGFVGSRRHIYDKHMLEKHGIQVWKPIDEPKDKKTEEDKPKIKTRKRKLKLTPVDNENICHICGSFQKTSHGFRRHMSVHEESTTKYGNKYDCPKCKYPTLAEHILRLHMTKAHHETHNNTCSICGFVGSRRWNYDKHMLDKHNIQAWTPIDDPNEEKAEVHKSQSVAKICNICGMLQKTSHGFRNHMNIHEDSAELYGNKYDCPKCKYPTLSEFKLRYHMTKAHQVTNNNTCSICDYVGSRRHHYEKHMLDKHGIQTWKPIDDPKEDTTETSMGTDEGDAKHPRRDRSLMLQCEHCTAFYKTTQAFERHQNTHKLSSELGNKFDCDLCGFPTISGKLLEYHKRRVHQPHFMHTCSICDHKTRRFSQLKMHMQKYHKQVNMERNLSRTYRNWSENRRKDGRYQCKLCNYLYTDSGSLGRHMQEHEKSNQLDDMWQCEKCKFPCTSEERLRRHMKKKHEEKLAVTCTICQKAFNRPHLLKVHMIMHQRHDQSFDCTTGLFSCNLCDFKVKTLRGLEAHIVHAHRFANMSKEAWKLSQDSYICSQCGRSFLDTIQLRRHVRTIHEGRYTHRCEVCGIGFEAKCSLERHLKVHSQNREKEFVCDICGAAYTEKRAMTKHIEQFHLGLGGSSSTQKTLNCKFCNEKYPHKYLLDNHLRKAHEEIFTFKCDLCDKTYISGSSLRLHKEIHHSEGAGAGAHACEYCEKQFPHKHNVLNHYRFCAVKKKLKPN